MKRRHRGLVKRSADCPDCGTTVRWREQAGIRRFQPKAKECPNCGRVWR